MSSRKIVHVDLDAFYASVEQRDDPSLKGRPVVVAWRGPRSVVCAASYEARRFGIRSAMPAVRAERLCPEAVFVPPNFVRYREVSRDVRRIMSLHTDLIEPLSLDEAYLDVTTNKLGLGSATEVATAIRDQIRDELRVTASAGIAPNKFLAKLASDMRKPDGQFVIRPGDIDSVLPPLQAACIPGIGKVTDKKLEEMGVRTIAQLRELTIGQLQQQFGRYGQRLYELARGIDHELVVPNRPVQSVSAEDTFANDVRLSDTDEVIRRLSEKVWAASQKTSRVGRTIVLKLKTSDFRILTRSYTPVAPAASALDIEEVAFSLRDRVTEERETLYRLVGVGLSNFVNSAELDPQVDLFPKGR